MTKKWGGAGRCKARSAILRKKPTPRPSGPRKWLLAETARGIGWRELERKTGINHATLIGVANGRRKAPATLVAAWRAQRGPAPSTMRRLLPRLVRWMRSRQIVEQNKPRVYARGGARVEL